jgi:hypothetical protein
MTTYYRILMVAGLLICIPAIPFLIAEGEWDALALVGPIVIAGLTVLVYSIVRKRRG